MKLGEIILKAGLLTKEQLQQALIGHKTSNLKLGQFLVKEGIVRESQIVDLLANQLRLEKYQPNKYPINLELAGVVPPEMANRHQVSPLEKSGLLLKIAMIDPLDINAVDTIERYTKTEVETVICTEHELNQLHKSIYGSFGGIDGVLQGIGEVEINNDADKSMATEDVEVNFLQGMAEETPVVLLVNSILSQAIQDSASDVHISPQKDHVRVRFRVDGKLYDVPAPPQTMFLPIVSRLKILAGMDIAVSRIPQDGRFTVKMKNKDINIRAATIPSIHGENIVLRLLDTSNRAYSLDSLGMSDTDRKRIGEIIFKPHGMILSTGPTGSGKSTSLYSILKKINQPDINIITVEDPIEYGVDNILQLQINRKAGMTFAGSLRSILRQDPDVVMVGEIRDPETAKISVQASLTGHRVLSTLHTNDSASAITRLLDMGIPPFLVSSVLLVSIAQRLVRKICNNCKEPYTPSKEMLGYWRLDMGDNGYFKQGIGCLNCMNTGYKDRTGIYEVLIIDDKIQDMILNKKSANEITRTAIEFGKFKSLRENAIEKVFHGITTLEEATSAVMV